MRDGVLQQCDSPRTLYRDPANAFVAGFIGSPPMNLVDGVAVDGGVRLRSTVIRADAVPAAPGAAVTVGVRPESLCLASAGEGIPATVSIVEELGAEAFVYAQLEGADGAAADAANLGGNVIVRGEPGAAPRAGERVHLRVKEGSMLFFDAVSGARLRR
jgi:multiple sugar transport system ATP-binding protein